MHHNLCDGRARSRPFFALFQRGGRNEAGAPVQAPVSAH
jgi:hypothetical protein